MEKELLTASETLVMKCIWDADFEMSLGDIFEEVNNKYAKAWKYQTVSTFLAKLVQKGFIRARREGHRMVYEILVPEMEYKSKQARDFVDFWNNGSSSQFLQVLYKGRRISAEAAEELRRTVDELAK